MLGSSSVVLCTSDANTRGYGCSVWRVNDLQAIHVKRPIASINRAWHDIYHSNATSK